MPTTSFRASLHGSLRAMPPSPGGTSTDAFDGGATLNAAAAAISGGIVLVALFPVDSVKTHMQARGDTVLSALRSMSSDRGLLRPVYRGIAPAIAEHALNRSILFGVGSYARRATPESWPDPLRDAVSGAGAALFKTAVLHPADTLKCRWQLGQPRDQLSGLYQGFAPAALRSSVGMAIWLSSRNALERRLAPAAGEPDARPWRHFISGAASSCLTDLCTFPLDTLKKWLQAAAPPAARGPDGDVGAPTISTAARELLSAGGIRRFYFGYAPRLLMVAINGACFNSVFVATKRVLAPVLGERAR